MSYMQGGDPFTSVGIKVDLIIFLVKIGLMNEHKKMFNL
jgi:hypothetical protein